MGMDPSSALHQQEMGTHQTLESMLVCPKTQQLEEKKPRPQPTEAAALKCPRCESNNTKFCYYNNYSLSQPRYFCKSCKRYWTQGGTLRNVPVGGGCRKTKRPSPSSSSSSASASAIRSHDQPITAINPNPLSPLFPASTHDYYSSSDILSLAFAGLHNQSGTHHYPNGFQNLYYGVGNGNLGSVENVGEETKQEIWNGRGEAESRGLWGIPIPWGINGSSGEGNYIGDMDSSGRESWNGIGNSSSNWHGLVNSTLM